MFFNYQLYHWYNFREFLDLPYMNFLRIKVRVLFLFSVSPYKNPMEASSFLPEKNNPPTKL